MGGPMVLETSSAREEQEAPRIIGDAQPRDITQEHGGQPEDQEQCFEQPEVWIQRQNPSSFHKHMCRVGCKIQERLQAIIDENNDRIRDCKMRVDGMAMATQWANGETNVQIALEMRRDSRHMRSIALVTMVFLPGTFFASVFSMTFFNWDSDGSSADPILSHWFWIYVVFTFCATVMTIVLWWFFVVHRPSLARKAAGNEKQD
ncbi:hypothetical protein MFIFM68171_06696 [Madurella fahalii]|uniref:Uncharacterized protein n=1 Tax=Madurella fahalii TaxID=1157608 RepID=A0ABQ0GFD8_9PEZI